MVAVACRLRKKMPSISGSDLIIRKAVFTDLETVKRIADAHRHELGFVVLSALRERIERNEMLVAVRDNELIGFVDYHKRRDGQLTLYRIAIDEEDKGQRVGQALIDNLVVIARAQGCSQIILKCPVDLRANQFYEQHGFTPAGTVEGRRRSLNIWAMSLDHTTQSTQE